MSSVQQFRGETLIQLHLQQEKISSAVTCSSRLTDGVNNTRSGSRLHHFDGAL